MLHGTYDVIVLGLGAMGSATAFELARRGRRVLGLEQFTLGHDQGSSHGRTRVIRRAYYEHPSYVPLVTRAAARWYELEQRQGRHLLTECPCLSLGRPDGPLVSGVRRAAADHGLAVEELSPRQVVARYPLLAPDDDMVGLIEGGAGFVRVEDAVLAYAQEAQLLGADLRENTPVMAWSADAAGVVVATARHRFAAERLVITAGPWANRLLGSLGVPLTIMRQTQLWWDVAQPGRLRRDIFPIYVVETPPGDYYYGLPVVTELGHKCARHYGGQIVNDMAHLDRTITPQDEADVRAFLKQYLPPLVDSPLRKAVVCPYTMTPDRHFVIDVHPHHPNVCLAAGFSGHGFKFASVVGEILADLVETGRTALPIDPFCLGRFAPSP